MVEENEKLQAEDKTGEKRVRRIEPILIIALSVLAVVCVLFAVFFSYALKARGSGDIFPNVRVQGTNLGGLSPEDAVGALGASGLDPFYNKTLQVRFQNAGEGDFTVTAIEAGLALDLEQIARTAYGYGRDGNLLQNAVSYIRCRYFGGADLSVDTGVSLNTQRIAQKARESCDRLRVEPTAPNIKIGEKSLVVTTGVSGRMFEAEELSALICARLTAGNFEDLVCVPTVLKSEAVSLEAAYTQIHQDAQNPVYVKELDDFTEEKAGVTFDLKAANAAVAAAGEGKSVTVAYQTVEPTKHKAEMKALLFRDLLSRSYTTLAVNADRTTNVRIGAEGVDGAIVGPGEVFSFNSYVGPYTEAAGYKNAPAYQNGMIVQDLGGGVCQIASGIYYCTLYANLEIVYRTCHLYVPSYIPYGLDATVSYGALDYKFRNNTDYPIKILAWVDGGQLKIEFRGTNVTGGHVEMECVTVSEDPYAVIYEDDPTMEPGSIYYKTSGFPGCTVYTYRKTYNAEGTLILREFEDSSIYTRRDLIIVRGPAL